MIKIFYGDDRGKAGEAVRKELGEGYEVVEGENLKEGGLNDIFFGMSLLSEERRVLIRDLGENKEALGELAERVERYLGSESRVVILETKLDKRVGAVKKILGAGVEAREFKVVG